MSRKVISNSYQIVEYKDLKILDWSAIIDYEILNFLATAVGIKDRQTSL